MKLFSYVVDHDAGPGSKSRMAAFCTLVHCKYGKGNRLEETSLN